MGALTSCTEQIADRATCESGDGQVAITWQPLPGIDNYRVFRANDGMTAEAIGEVGGTSFVDSNAENGTLYGYIVRAVVPEGVESPDLAACEAIPQPGSDPTDVAAVADLSCRAKSGKVDLAWQPVADAVSYRVLRALAGSGFSQLGEIASPPYVDLTVVDGNPYAYSVVSVAANGATSALSTSCSATPGPNGGGDPPPAVSDLSCRGKRDKVDLSWTAVSGAAFYRVFRNVAGVTTPAGEVANGVFVDFGITPSAVHQYVVRAVAADGTESADSAVCAYSATDRDGGNRAPQITSTPLTNALERQAYRYEVVATDPEGDPVALSTVQAPPGMFFEESSNTLTWIPVESQVGPHTVELRATDPQSAFGTQTFVVVAADLNEPPRITSVPVPRAQVGEAYRYDVEAFDPEETTLGFSFAEPPPSGMTIDPASGVVSWTPTAAALGRSIAVRATDAGGAFEDQRFQLDATQLPLDLTAPEGEFTVEVGDTLELRFVSNYAGSKYLARPLPKGATQQGDLFRFTPEPGQAGRYELIFKAVFADLKDATRVAIRVTDSNQPPAFGALGPFTVAEGAVLRFPVAATDADADALTITAPALGLENAVFDEFSHELIFQPSFEQAGSYQVGFRASDGANSAETSVAIEVTDAVPPVGDLQLVVNPPQSPTFVTGQTISGSVVGEVASVSTPVAALVTGLSPTNAQQGRPVTVAITGRNTNFVQGETTATFGDGITVDSFTVTSPTQASANLSVSPIAAVGIRQMRVQQAGQEVPSVVAFRVEEGAAVVRGVLRDAFTGEPLVNVRVTVNGTNASAVTGADGSFEIVGAPPGAQTLVVVAPNFEVAEVNVNLEENVTYELGEPIGLDALARPARPGGSLPRAQTLASIIDRGVSTVNEPITQEEAELLISDTMIAIGGNQLGVMDDSGQQRNPRITGPGMLSLTPAAVEAYADRLVRGDSYTLGGLAFGLRGSFGWIFPGLDEDTQIAMLQESVNRAWANVANPDFALVIAIFNPGGTTLSNQPPILTRDTQLNSFQSFLFISSFMVRMFPILDMAFDEKLRALGIDPRELLEDAGIDGDLYAAAEPSTGSRAVTRLGEKTAAWAGIAGDLAFGGPANAQTGGGTGTPGIGQRVWGGVTGALWYGMPSALTSGAVNIAFAAGIAILCGVLGVFGPLATLSLLGAFLVGVATTMIAKFVGGFLADPKLPERYTPNPPALISQVDPTVDDPNFFLRFKRAEGDINADRARRANPNLNSGFLGGWVQDGVRLWNGSVDERLLEYRYALWKYPCDPDQPACKATKGASIAGREPLSRESMIAPLSRDELNSLYNPIPDPNGNHDPVRGNAGEFEQFRVLKTRLTDGMNFFRIQAIQFYRRMWNGINPDGDEVSIPYRDVGVEVQPFQRPPNAAESIGEPFRGNANQEIGKLVVEGLPDLASRTAQANEQWLETMRLAAQRVEIRGRAERAHFAVTGETTAAATLEQLEKQAGEALANLRARITPIRARVSAHANITTFVGVGLNAEGVSRGSVQDVVNALTNPNTFEGRLINASLADVPSARPAFNNYVSAKVGQQRIGNAVMRHNDTILELRRVQAELAARVGPHAGQAEFPPIDLGSAGRIDELPGRLGIRGTTVDRVNNPRQPFEVGPIASQQAYDQAITRINAEIATQEAEILRLDNHMNGNEGTWKADFDARTKNFQDTFYDETTFRSEMDAFEVKQRNYREVQKVQQLQKQAAATEARVAQLDAGLRPPGEPKGFRATADYRRTMTTSVEIKKGVRASFGLNVSNVIGVATEVGNEIHGLRSGIDVLTSKLSPTLMVSATTLPPDPLTGRARIQVDTSPLPPGTIQGEFNEIPVASLFDATSEPVLPQFAVGLARGPLARLFQRPMSIDDAGRVVAGGGSRLPRTVKRASFTGPAGLPIQFESDPDPKRMLGVLYPSGPPPENPRDGFLFREFPFSPAEPERFGAGFPSELIAVDSQGRVYLENFNSNEAFGGRVFRYAGIPAEREHVGSVNYYSQTLMYAHPAAPIAMEIGDARDASGNVVEDLFLVNKDLGVYFDAGRRPVHRVLRLMIHQLDTVPAYANGQNRNRLVAQPWAEHPDFRFDGAADLEVDARSETSFAAGERPLYLSDLDSLYILRDENHDGTAEVSKIAQVPGRNFSGIASDLNGNLFVADYGTGEVYLIPQQVLDAIASGAQPPFASDAELDARAYLIKVDLDRPGDIELDTYGHRYIVSTPGGLVPFDIPAVGRLTPDVAEIHVDAIGSEIPVTLRGSRGNMFMMGANSEGTFAGKEVRIRVRRVNGGTGQSEWDSFLIRTQLSGATVLEDGALARP